MKIMTQEYNQYKVEPLNVNMVPEASMPSPTSKKRTKVIIELTETEAGWLKSLLGTMKYNSNSFQTQLFINLSKLKLTSYHNKYPDYGIDAQPGTNKGVWYGLSNSVDNPDFYNYLYNFKPPKVGKIAKKVNKPKLEWL